MLLEEERRAVAEGSRRLAAKGLVVGTAGNVSARNDDLVVVTPTGATLAELTPELLTVVSLDGEVVEGELAPTSETPLHLGIYAVTEAGAVAHAHALASTAVACTHEELPPLHYTTLELGGVPRVAPFAPFGTRELADHVAAALEGRNAALMANHGSVAYGEDVAQACERIELLEWHAELFWRAQALGTPHVLSEQDLADVITAALTGGYGVLRRLSPEE